MLCSLLLAAAAQEPAPPAPTIEEQILAAIDKLRGSYDDADEKVRSGVETPAADADARGAALRPAESALEVLVADMEALLALLPKPPS